MQTTRDVHRDHLPTDPAHLAPGAMVDHFRVLRPLGRGGEGVVYLARDTLLGRKVALKLLRQRDETAQRQLLLEAQATARFSHPHIVTIYAVGTHQAHPYLALEYLEGPSLRSRIEERSLAPREVLRIGAAIADALAEAHKHGVLHRDLKPENVLIPSDGRVRVVDFGIAELVDLAEEATSDDPLRGTPDYLAPEQWRREATTDRTDLWALGVLLHEMAAGERPYADERGLRELLARVSSPEPVPPLEAVSPALAALIGRCLAKAPGDRPPASEVAEALHAQLATGRAHSAGDQSPFRGLEAYDERHAALFFGRDRELTAFLERLREIPVLPVVGPSGAGKSSFVHAGVLPRLREQGSWTVLRLRPGGDPFRTLATRLELASRGEGELPTEERPLELAAASGESGLAGRLRESPSLLASQLERLASELGHKVLLVVDQLEELATQVEDEAVRQAFMEAICAAADDAQGPVRVIFTLREDFLSRLALTPRIRQVLGQVTLLGAPDPAALEEILTAPLRDLDYRYEDPKLIREMIEAAGTEAASLPLLQFTAHRLWEKRDTSQRRLTRAAYDAIAGVAGALASHADGVIEGLAAEDERCARELFLRLVTPERLRRAVPVPQLLAGLPPSAEQVLGQLTRARLVSTRKSRKADGAAVAELVHESLVRHWSRLARWIDRSREDLAFLEETGQAAELWDRRGRRDDDLWQGETLRQGLYTLRRCTAATPELVRRFLAEGEAKERRRRTRRRSLAAIAVTILAALVAVFAYQKEQADRQRNQTRLRWAEAQREGARAALARGDLLEARAKLRGALETEDSLQARALWRKLERDPQIWSRSFEGPFYSVAFSADGRTLVAAGLGSVVALETETRTLRVLRVTADRVLTVATSPRGTGVALGTWSGEVLLTDLVGSRSQALGRHRGAVWTLGISPDGKRLASGGEDRRVLVFKIDEPAQQPQEITTEERVTAVAFDGNNTIVVASTSLRHWRLDCEKAPCSPRLAADEAEEKCGKSSLATTPDGAWTALGCMSREVRLRGPAARTNLTNPTDSVIAVAISLDGRRLASADQSGQILVWDVATQKLERVLQAHSGRCRGLAISPDGQTLASGGDDGSVRLWSLRGRPGTPPARGHDGPVENLVFLPDAELASVGSDGRLRFWETRSGRERRAVAISGEGLKDLAASPDSGLLAVAGEPDSIWIWDRTRLRLRKLGTQTNPQALAFSPSGLLASAGNEMMVRLWDTATGERKHTFTGHSTTAYGLSFSPDGRRLASALRDGTRVWDPGTGKSTQVLSGHQGAVHGVAYSPDGTQLVSSGADGTVRLWNQAGAGRIVDRFPGRSYRLAFHPKNVGLLGVGHSDGTAGLLDLTTGKKRLLRGHQGDVNSLRFSPDGRLAATAGDDGTVRLFEVASGRPAWRGPALLAAPPRLLSHLGWRRLDGRTETATPPGSAWRGALEERAHHADQAPDRRTLCLRTLEGELEIWDQLADRRIHRETIPGLREVVALEGGCLALDGGEARIYRGASLVRRLPASAAARDRARGRVLVASGRQVLVLAAVTGVELERHGTSGSVRALARIGDRIALGFEDGSLELTGKTASFEEVPASPVRRILEGPRGTLAAGYANGRVGLWHLETGARLDAVKLHGPVAHLLLEGDSLYAATELGDAERIDLALLSLDYCALVRRVQRAVPVVWEGGQPVPRAPQRVPGCR